MLVTDAERNVRDRLLQLTRESCLPVTAPPSSWLYTQLLELEHVGRAYSLWADEQLLKVQAVRIGGPAGSGTGPWGAFDPASGEVVDGSRYGPNGGLVFRGASLHLMASYLEARVRTRAGWEMVLSSAPAEWVLAWETSQR